MARNKKYIIPKREIFSESMTFNLTPDMLNNMKRVANDNDCDVSMVVREGCKMIINKWRKCNGLVVDEEPEDE